MNLAADHRRHHLRVTGVGHVDRVNAGSGFEQFHADVPYRTHAR